MKNGPYILTMAPEDYPGKKYRGKYAYEHHVVLWKKTGKVPHLNGKHVHRQNHNTVDNRINNLKIIDGGAHASLHANKPWTYVFETCGKCENVFRLPGSLYRNKIKNYGTLYCSAKCQHQSMKKAR